MKARPFGFTLVELLVVVGTIALLITLLLPTLARVRAAATDTACRSRLHELYVAEQLYAGQNRDRMTAVATNPAEPSPFASGAASWREEVAHVLKIDRDSQAFECPTADDPAHDGSYGINSCIMMPKWGLRFSGRRTDGTEVQVAANRRAATVSPFSQLILFADKGPSGDVLLRSSDGRDYAEVTDVGGTFPMWRWWSRHTPLSSLRHGNRNDRTANAVFMDGHVGPVKDELRIYSGHWYFGAELEATQAIGATCCQ